MKRVLRVTVVLFGIGLIGMVAMLETTRHTKEAGPVLLAVEIDSFGNEKGLFLHGVGSTIRRYIPSHPTVRTKSLQWSADGQWLYGIYNRTLSDYSHYVHQLWRISRDGRRLEWLPGTIIAPDTDNIALSPDGQWLIYVEIDPLGNFQIMRVPTDDPTQPYDLSADAGLPTADPDFLRVSADSQWVYLMDETNLYRVPMVGGRGEKVTSQGGFGQPVAITNKWVLMWSSHSLTIMNPDGTNPRVLFPDDGEINPSVFMWQAIWLQNQQMAIVGTTDQFGTRALQAYAVPDGTRLWRYADLRSVGTYRADGWIMAMNADYDLVSLWADGRESPHVILEEADYDGLVFAKGVVVFLRERPAASEWREWWRLFPDGQTLALNQILSQSAYIQSLSSDQEWAVITDYLPTFRQIVLRLDGTYAYELPNATVVDWLPPIDRTW
ncbi:MAG: DUF5050 domain-containing protein, partial [Anaerolineae bacterium]|nr:DUF5050 domain-containing protein [Anaerolineae bacterium]